MIGLLSIIILFIVRYSFTVFHCLVRRNIEPYYISSAKNVQIVLLLKLLWQWMIFLRYDKYIKTYLKFVDLSLYDYPFCRYLKVQVLKQRLYTTDELKNNGSLVVFYDISTIVGYLMPNPVNTYNFEMNLFDYLSNIFNIFSSMLWAIITLKHYTGSHIDSFS